MIAQIKRRVHRSALLLISSRGSGSQGRPCGGRSGEAAKYTWREKNARRERGKGNSGRMTESVFLDFIEVGTSDFDTLIQNADEEAQGLSIEPVKTYLDRLPNSKKCIKLNAAISNFDGEISVYYVTADKIENFGLPAGLRGCNSVGAPHPTIERILKERNISNSDVVTNEIVPAYRLSTIIEKFNVRGIFYLKIDAEGHDVAILEDYFINCKTKLLPHRLQFESNSLADNDKLHLLIAQLILVGYDVVRCETGGPESDTLLQLNVRRIKNRSSFTQNIDGYYLSDYPEKYLPASPPHLNTLADAQAYCVAYGYGGVTYQYGRFEVRKGDYLRKDKYPGLISWILL